MLRLTTALRRPPEAAASANEAAKEPECGGKERAAGELSRAAKQKLLTKAKKLNYKKASRFGNSPSGLFFIQEAKLGPWYQQTKPYVTDDNQYLFFTRINPFAKGKRFFSTSAVLLADKKTTPYPLTAATVDNEVVTGAVSMQPADALPRPTAVKLAQGAKPAEAARVTAKDKKSKRSWFHHETPVKNVILDNPTISHYVKNFWKKVVNNISDNQHVYVLFRVEFAKEGLIKTISNKMLHLTKADRDWFIKYVIASADSREDWYKNTELSKIIFSVGIRDGVIEPKGSDYSVYSTDSQEKTRKAVATERQNYKHFGLPITMDPFKYGIVKHSPAENEFYVGITDKTDGVITVTKKNGITTNHVKYFRENDLVFDWEDTAEEGALRGLG